MVEFVRTYNPEYAQQIEKQKENYLAFLKYPEEIRRHIYTTNIVESINSGIELMRLKHGGYFGCSASSTMAFFCSAVHRLLL
jgi:putative transposase